MKYPCVQITLLSVYGDREHKTKQNKQACMNKGPKTTLGDTARHYEEDMPWINNVKTTMSMSQDNVSKQLHKTTARNNITKQNKH